MDEAALRNPDAQWRFWIDRGGTFTDVVARAPDGTLRTAKLLSENPRLYDDAALAGIARLMGLPPGAPVPPDRVHSIKMGTTVATNALLQRTGEPTVLVVNRGLADLLVIGNQTRPRLFDLQIVRPLPLYERVIEIAGRLAADGQEIEPIDEAAASRAFAELHAQGLRSCGIALMHAWQHARHEVRLGELARAAGFGQISLSHSCSTLLGLVRRAQTAVIDAYLSPVLRRHVDRLAASLDGTRLFFMQSHGGLARAEAFAGRNAILSGPAGGIVGAARTAERAGFPRIITFDMGGTSTDVALYAGSFARSSESALAGIEIGVPMLAINTVAAGGGSVVSFDGARLQIGPQSAGAEPGPACYRMGGPPTVTDANLVLGKIQQAYFPAVFGPKGDERLDSAAARAAFEALAGRMCAEAGGAWTAQSAAEGAIRIAVARMAAAIKQVSIAQGENPADFTLQCFGGAGGQHACLLADELGMQTVLVHPLAGVLSAYGMGLAEQTVLREQGLELALTERAMPQIEALASRMSGEAEDALCEQGVARANIRTQALLHLRYRGTEGALPVAMGTLDAMRAAFTAEHGKTFGFASPEREIVAERAAVEAAGGGEPMPDIVLQERLSGIAQPASVAALFSVGASHEAPVFIRDQLLAGDCVAGPALICDPGATTVVELGWQGTITIRGDLVLTRDTPVAAEDVHGRRDLGGQAADPVLLEVFNNLFMHVAEQTGVVLRRTAVSVNIKERLDFSCAIFDPDGALIANAPHVPVHLGAMGESVRSVLRARGDSLHDGDVIALNDPYRGGTHLPDVTVVTPIFSGCALRFFVANRAHHADIGGTTPGSTPPDSSRLQQEGVVIADFLLVSEGILRDAAFRALLAGGPYPARNPDMNVADIKAQIAANASGSAELQRVIARHGWPTVQAYMGHVRANGEEAIRRVLARTGGGSFAYCMDDGTALHVAVTVDRQSRSATVDFTGTGPQHAGNFNAPPAVTRAAVLYVFRCLVGHDIPLNDGCLVPLTIVIPPGTFLSPAPGAAVVAGNTEVSQAVTNALFGALGALACSQGTMNNLLFGNAKLQYYETICGGAGAGAGFDGASAVHTHMTNTRITDPEVLELRYPVRLETFAVRRHSGGAGLHRGGDGAIRRIRFLAPITLTIVASRRTVAPFGLHGGGDGAVGRQWIERADGAVQILLGQDRAEICAGDLVVIETPGGGGFGQAVDSAQS